MVVDHCSVSFLESSIKVSDMRLYLNDHYLKISEELIMESVSLLIKSSKLFTPFFILTQFCFQSLNMNAIYKKKINQLTLDNGRLKIVQIKATICLN